MRVIKIKTYDPNWLQLYDFESDQIKRVLNDNLLEIHHIGSTSVAGLAAKPVIDIIALVKNFADAIIGLEAIGFESRGEMCLPFRRYFRKDQSVNLHLYENSSPEVYLNLCFRNYLRANQEAKDEYQKLKYLLLKDQRIGAKDYGRFSNYNLGKDDFIRKILQKAGFNEFRLMYCNHRNEWYRYHSIRKKQLFDRANLRYDKKHPTIFSSDCFHFILYKGVEIVTIAMVEFLDDKIAVLRGLATDEPYKRKGYAQEMMHLLERWVKYQNRQVIKMHANLEAELFYRKLGYAEIEFNDISISHNVIDMGKYL
jgi:GrpB-like predicted nucleotidyltransferase (UPF0157 family)/GNAT superfamily N-acetyltransferase